MQLVGTRASVDVSFLDNAQTPHGVSPEAETLEGVYRDFARLDEQIRQTIVDLQSKVRSAISNEIDRVAAECGANGWSGEEECVAISKESTEQAKRFVSLIDVSQFPLPDAVPEQDGDLALEWHRDDEHWVLASFQPDGRVNYACRLGEGTRATGTNSVSVVFAKIMERYLASVYAG